MTETNDILFEEHNGLGLVTLNRPQALNSLTLEMCQALDRQLVAWTADAGVRAVLVRGAGDKAFCAGGDVRAVWDSGKAGEIGEGLTAEFFRWEYTLNNRIHSFPKPYIPLFDGITMGGGVGISVHGSHRVAGDRTLWAMPETGIGLFPDVGGSYFLPRLPGQLGRYLGLTGQRLVAGDCVYAGIAEAYVPSARADDLIKRLGEAALEADDMHDAASGVIEGLSDRLPAGTLQTHRREIDRCFSGDTIEEILDRLEAEGGDWADSCRAVLLKAAPLSLKVTMEALRRGAEAESFAECMEMEYRMSQAFMAGHDFYEGIRALLIDRDKTPHWRPETLEDVSEEMVDAVFRSLGDKDLRLAS